MLNSFGLLGELAFFRNLAMVLRGEDSVVCCGAMAAGAQPRGEEGSEEGGEGGGVIVVMVIGGTHFEGDPSFRRCGLGLALALDFSAARGSEQLITRCSHAECSSNGTCLPTSLPTSCGGYSSVPSRRRTCVRRAETGERGSPRCFRSKPSV